MENHNPTTQNGSSGPNPSPDFGSVPNGSESFGRIPNSSENFRSVPNTSEPFRTVRNASEKSDQHTLSVRDVARQFEQSGVPRTERSIINWCQPNRQGITRLDAFLDTNERRYFITPQSVNRAIEEERARATSAGAQSPASEALPNRPQSEPQKASEHAHSTGSKRSETQSEDESRELTDLRRKVVDLEITNRVKEQLLGRMNDEIQKKDDERRAYIERLIANGQLIGEMKSQLVQLGAPVPSSALPNGSEGFRNSGETTHEAAALPDDEGSR